MRKVWYAGAALAGGIALFGAPSAALADPQPGTGTVPSTLSRAGVATQQADQQLADLLGRTNSMTNDMTVENPLRFSSVQDSPLASNPVIDMHRGQNGPDLGPITGRSEATGAPDDPRPDRPSASVIGGLRDAGSGVPLNQTPVGQIPVGQIPVDRTPVGSTSLGPNPLQRLNLAALFGGGSFLGQNSLPLAGGGNSSLFGAFGPDGSRPSLGRPSFAPTGFAPSDRDGSAPAPDLSRTEHFEGGLPLLGGLGGMLPANSKAPIDGGPTDTDPTGLPAGGLTILPAVPSSAAKAKPAPDTTLPAPAAAAGQAVGDPAVEDPAVAPTAGPSDAPSAAPGKAKPTPVATPDDPRLHEEPIDGEAGRTRPFSPDTRPVAGVDEQYR